jgi:Integral membrane protein S linking to the trans Golgi network
MARRRRPPRPGALTELPPLKILSQIIILQTIHYVCGTALILFAALVAGRPRFTTDLVLNWRSLRGDTTVGWMLGVCWMADGFIGYDFCIKFYFPLSLFIVYLFVSLGFWFSWFLAPGSWEKEGREEEKRQKREKEEE